jgi:hypothetical protein
VVTFLFTDVEGSTRRWEADANAMRAALLVHYQVLRTAIETHGGYLFSHTGDGVVAAFASPRSAVDAAVAAQRRVELPVRMGIATGEAELRDADYFGTVLNRAARVMAAGHGGQILLAESAAGLLSGVDLADLGPRRLRDLPIPVGVFQVRAPGLRTDFPPLRALDVSLLNLVQGIRGGGWPPDSGQVLLDAVDNALESRGEIRPTESSTRAELATLSWPETVAWLGKRLAEALHYATSRGVLHRDIKLANPHLFARDRANTGQSTEFGFGPGLVPPHLNGRPPGGVPGGTEVAYACVWIPLVALSWPSSRRCHAPSSGSAR